jgi:circadian clock protein KaiC
MRHQPGIIMSIDAEAASDRESIRKAPTGISGLDEVTQGGLPCGRPTLVCGGAGSGKTMMAMEFLVNGARHFAEPGVFVSFEERAEDLVANVASLGFNLAELIDGRKLYIDHVQIERNHIEETGEYDLEGLFIRLNFAIEAVGARRVVLDTIETLFSSLEDTGILRAELNRLFRWLKDRGITAVITAERGEGTLTRHGLEEYVSDCVISLDHRVDEQISTRRLRIVKYRGSAHGTNEYPFLIDAHGFSVMPVTSLGLDHVTSNERISSGVPGLDEMLEGKGFYRGSSILVSGTPGTGKSTFAAHMAHAACSRGERALYFAFEESPHQIIRNMRSIGLDLEQWAHNGLLRFHASRPTLLGMEAHLVMMHRALEQFKPQVMIMDPMSNLRTAGTRQGASAVMLRMIDYLKREQITAVFTNLTEASGSLEQTEMEVSSLMDAWILLRDVEVAAERNRAAYVLKSRGMAHSNQLREFTFTSRGIQMVDAYVGPGGVLTGLARLSQEALDEAERLRVGQEIERLQRDLQRRRSEHEAQTALFQGQWQAQQDELEQKVSHAQLRYEQMMASRRRMEVRRGFTSDSRSGPQV